MNKRSIMLVIPTYKSGGMERIMNELGNLWSDQGHHIEILFLVSHKPFYPIHPKITQIIKPDFRYKKTVLSKIWYSIRLLFFVRRKMSKSKAKAVLSFGEVYNSFVLLAGLFLGKKIFVSDRNSPFIKRKRHFEWLRNVLYPKAAGIIAQTEASKDFLLKKTGNPNIKVIPNPVRTFKESKEERRRERNIILNIGRLEKQKNQIALIRIFKKIGMLDWELHILGGGSLKKVLENEIERLDLTPYVKLHGIQKNVGEFMSRSSIFAMTSIFEGYPNALIEAMAFPLASISYDCDTGPREIIKNDENGFLVELNNEEQFAEKLEGLMRLPQKRLMFENESSKLGFKQSLNIIAEKYLNFLFYEDTN
ncbi:glycosyltransferase [Flagellimonas sp. HMM57]|uniref:glycosyltransferase n=1 Tax=unclassified Flagellimonas TaxID=2644544 RepID=UPI0013D4AD1F|nr:MULTISPECIES: glycosyltransferase [unclassified Flagellimonas]UII77601.1 glycosyltransferase [Flagellimonas sp. HMM57]